MVGLTLVFLLGAALGAWLGYGCGQVSVVRAVRAALGPTP